MDKIAAKLRDFAGLIDEFWQSEELIVFFFLISAILFFKTCQGSAQADRITILQWGG